MTKADSQAIKRIYEQGFQFLLNAMRQGDFDTTILKAPEILQQGANKIQEATGKTIGSEEITPFRFEAMASSQFEEGDEAILALLDQYQQRTPKWRSQLYAYSLAEFFTPALYLIGMNIYQDLPDTERQMQARKWVKKQSEGPFESAKHLSDEALSSKIETIPQMRAHPHMMLSLEMIFDSFQAFLLKPEPAIERRSPSFFSSLLKRSDLIRPFPEMDYPNHSAFLKSIHTWSRCILDRKTQEGIMPEAIKIEGAIFLSAKHLFDFTDEKVKFDFETRIELLTLKILAEISTEVLTSIEDKLLPMEDIVPMAPMHDEDKIDPYEGSYAPAKLSYSDVMLVKLQEKLDTLKEAIELLCEDTPLKPVTLDSLRNITGYVDLATRHRHEEDDGLNQRP